MDREMVGEEERREVRDAGNADGCGDHNYAGDGKPGCRISSGSIH